MYELRLEFPGRQQELGVVFLLDSCVTSGLQGSDPHSYMSKPIFNLNFWHFTEHSHQLHRTCSADHMELWKNMVGCDDSF